MKQHSNDEFASVTIAGQNMPFVSLSNTEWGYVIRSDAQLARRAALIERVCLATGIAFMIAAFGSWMFPQAHASVELGSIGKIASTAALSVPALMFLWIAERGMSSDMEVDTVKSQLRLCVCNRNGRARVLKAIPFEHVGSAYIKRISESSNRARLYLRIKGRKDAVQVAAGRETTMRVLHDRLSTELRPQRVQLSGWERVGRRLKPMPVLARAV